MQSLSAAQLLNVWESGGTRSLPERGLALLAAACPDTTREALAELNIGRRDAQLLTLREWTFGPRVFSVSLCPNCGEQLAIGFDLDEIRQHETAASQTAEASDVEQPVKCFSLQHCDYALSFRLLNSLDLDSISGQSDAAVSRRALFERCVLSAEHKGKAAKPAELPDELIAQLSTRMAQENPQADMQLALNCSSCGHKWQVLFDIVSFFWREIDEWAQRILREVHSLASAYGWTQTEILGLSPTRRQIYLELIANG